MAIEHRGQVNSLGGCVEELVLSSYSVAEATQAIDFSQIGIENVHDRRSLDLRVEQL